MLCNIEGDLRSLIVEFAPLPPSSFWLESVGERIGSNPHVNLPMIPNPCCCSIHIAIRIAATASMGLAILVVILQGWMIKTGADLHDVPVRDEYRSFREKMNTGMRSRVITYGKILLQDYRAIQAGNITSSSFLSLNPYFSNNPEYLYVLGSLFEYFFITWDWDLPDLEEIEKVCWSCGFIGLAGASFQLVSAITLLASLNGGRPKDNLLAKRWILITFLVIFCLFVSILILLSQGDSNWKWGGFPFRFHLWVLTFDFFILIYFLWVAFAYITTEEELGILTKPNPLSNYGKYTYT